MSPNNADGMANSVDPDQTALILIWVYTVCPDLSVRKLRKITVTNEFGHKAKKKNMCVPGFGSEKARYGRSA